MYGMNVLMPRPPSSPNKPPPSRPRPQPKGTPIPVNVNFLLTGSAITGPERTEHRAKSSKTKQRPHTAVVDKNIIKTLKRSPSVENSFYDRFERLDRDWIEGDKAYKENGGRVKGDKNGSRKVLPTPSRSKSSSAAQRNVLKHIPGKFLDLAIAYDESTIDNTTKSTKKNRIKSANVTRQERSARNRKRRSKSSHLSRERSISRKRSERSDSKSLASVASGSRCSSRQGNNRNRRIRGRKSRSRTRRDTPRYNDYGATSRQSPDRNQSLVRNKERVISATVVKVNPDKKQNELSKSDDSKRIINANSANPTQERKYSYVGTVKNRRVLSANVVKLRVDLKQLKDDDHSCVDAGLLRVSNEKGIRNKREMKHDTKSDPKRTSISGEKTRPQTADKETYIPDVIVYSQEEKKVSSNVPKLKMMVAPTALPTFLKTLSLRSLTRSHGGRNLHV